jgi:sortase A
MGGPKESAFEKLSLKGLILDRDAPEEAVATEEGTSEAAPPAAEATVPEEAAAPEEAAPEEAVAPEEEVTGDVPSETAPTPAPARASKKAAPKDATRDRGSRATREKGSGRNPGKDSERVIRAGAASKPVAKKEPDRRDQTGGSSKTITALAKPGSDDGADENRLSLTVPRLRLQNVMVGDSREQSYLDREGIMHLLGTGFPYQRDSNTYIAGHAGGVFRDLHNLRQGDRIVVRDAMGRTYDHRVYERLLVGPYDAWVTKPVTGKRIVSLQTCFPAPTFEKRLVVRGELVDL